MLNYEQLINENKFLEKENADLLQKIKKIEEDLMLAKCEVMTNKMALEKHMHESKMQKTQYTNKIKKYLKKINKLEKEAETRLQMFNLLLSDKLKCDDKIKELEMQVNDDDYINDINEVIKEFDKGEI